MESFATTTQDAARAITRLSWTEVLTLRDRLARRLPPEQPVYGVPTGGAFVAYLLAQVGSGTGTVLMAPERGCVVVDDLVDSGATLAPFQQQGLHCDALLRKPHSPVTLAPDAPTYTGWIKFPWEADHAPTDSIVRLLEYIGEDPHREGLLETPRRVLRAYAEMTGGYQQDPAAILTTTFTESYDEMVVLRNIEFVSLCEHHLLPFIGTAHVGYIPKGRVVGLSKLARLVQCLAQRLQIQERLTQQITQALTTHLDVLGAGAIVQAQHECMRCRGVRQQNATMVTSSLTGILRDDSAARAEFLALCGV